MKGFFDEDDARDLPQEFHWENMEAGIFDKMQKIQAQESKANRPIWKKKIYLSALILLLSLSTCIGLRHSIGTYARMNVMQENQAEESIDTRRKTIPSGNNEFYQNNPSLPVELDADRANAHQAMRLKSLSIDNPNTSLSTTPTPRNNKQNAAGVVSLNTDQVSSVNIYVHPISQIFDNEVTKQDDVWLITGNGVGDKISDNLNVIGSPQIPLIDTISEAKELSSSYTGLPDSSNFENKTNVLKDTLLTLAQASGSFTSKTKNSINESRQFGLESGVCVWDEGFRQSLPQRGAYESNLLSFQIQGYYMRNINPRTFLMAGLQYQELHSRFSYRAIIPDYTLILTDTIMHIHRDIITGHIENIYGDVEQTVEAVRVVVHHNTTKLFKLSIAAGKQLNFNRFQTDIYGGLALNTFSFNRGRTLLNNEIIDYVGSSNDVINNRLYLEVLAGGRIHFFLSQRIALTGGLQCQQSLMNWSNVENSVSYPLSVGLNLGLSYKFSVSASK
jgi:hypothetical protein